MISGKKLEEDGCLGLCQGQTIRNGAPSLPQVEAFVKIGSSSKESQSYNIFEVYAIRESKKSIFLLEGLLSTCHEFSSQGRSSGLLIDFVHVVIVSSTLDIV